MSDKPDENYEIKNPVIEQLLRDMGGTLKAAMPEGWGFSLLIFSYGPAGGMFYIASAQRDDMVRAYRELCHKLGVEAGTDETAANIMGRLLNHATKEQTKEEGAVEWGAIAEDAMTYLMRAKREHPDSAAEFWDRLKHDGLVS